MDNKNQLKKWGIYYDKNMDWQIFLKRLSERSFYLENLIEDNPRRILEVGCGTAIRSIFLSYLGFDVTAIDNDETILKQAQRNNRIFKGNVKIIKADAFNLSFPDDSFDLVHNAGFLEHFNDEEIRHLVREQLRVAKTYIFSVPNIHHSKRDFGDERLMTDDQWQKILSDFNIVDSRYYLKNWSSKTPVLLYQMVRRFLGSDIRPATQLIVQVTR